jgi:hypothetical protein
VTIQPILYLTAPQTVLSYVRELENRLAQVERLVREVCCDVTRFALEYRQNSMQLSNPESQLSQSLRESRKAKKEQKAVTHPGAAQGLPSSSFARIPRIDALGPLPEADEYENDDFVTLYDTSKGLADAYKVGDASRFFGEDSAFAFPENLGKDGPQSGKPSSRRPEFWAIPSVRSPRLVFRLSKRSLFNLLPVDAPYPERAAGSAGISRGEFDATPPGHLL